MSSRGNRSSAEKENSQNNSFHDQASSSDTGQVASGGSANQTPPWSPRDQGRDNREEEKGPSISRTPLKRLPADARSVPPTPSTTRSDLLRRLTMTKAPWATESVSPTASPVSSIPSSPLTTSMTTNREMQHDGKDPYNFYEDNDSERTVDYGSSPSASSSGSSSVWSNQSSRSSRGGTPAYGEDGWRSGSFLTSPRR